MRESFGAPIQVFHLHFTVKAGNFNFKQNDIVAVVIESFSHGVDLVPKRSVNIPLFIQRTTDCRAAVVVPRGHGRFPFVTHRKMIDHRNGLVVQNHHRNLPRHQPIPWRFIRSLADDAVESCHRPEYLLALAPPRDQL